MALQSAREVFKKGEECGMDMYFLDIGGGFPGAPGESTVRFEDMAIAINDGIKEFFSDVKNLKVISEPGRYFASKTHNLVFNVIGKKKNQENEMEDPSFMYYMNDGVYGCFNCIKYDDQHPVLVPYENKEGKKTFKTTVFGPTCDSIDVIAKDIELPEMNVGEWCYVENFGAYTQAAASNFNGFNTIPCHYIIRYD